MYGSLAASIAISWTCGVHRWLVLLIDSFFPSAAQCSARTANVYDVKKPHSTNQTIVGKKLLGKSRTPFPLLVSGEKQGSSTVMR